jgi:hypothetical protein
MMTMLLAFFTFTATAAYADTDQIRVCVDRDGDVRLVLPGKSCRATEFPVTLNLRGPQGPKGDKGDTGPKGATGAQGVAGPQGATGAQGPTGPRGAEGPQGPQGVPGATGSWNTTYPIVVDANNTEVGVATDPFSGIVMRRVGADTVIFFASPAGPDGGVMEFFHTTPDCTGDRYVRTAFQRGLAFFAQVHLGTIFYTTTVDPGGALQVPVGSIERFQANEDATQPGLCVPVEPGTVDSLGVVTTVSDPVIAGLTPPLRIK